MSIIRMSNLAIQREANLVEGVEPSAGKAGPAVQGALDKIAAYIPSEVIGTYVAISGIISPQSALPKWIIFGLSLLLIPVLTLINDALARRRGQTLPSGRARLYVIRRAGVAYCAWAAALPGNPLVAYYADATRIGGAAVILLAAVLPPLAEFLEIAPKGS
jgi:hypothetical protein